MTAEAPERPEQEVEEAFDRLVDEGSDRLARPLNGMIATGLLGGIDIGTGVLAYLAVEHETGSRVLASLAFSIGFVALLLARSELFTENFLVPVVAAVAVPGRLASLLRLWVVVLLTNLLGGWIITGLIVAALPSVRATAATTGAHYAELGISWQAFASAVLAGAVITLLTRMQHATENLGVQIVPAILFGALLPLGQLFHCILDSLLMFAGLWAGAPYGYLDWLGAFAWSAVGNLVGGLGLVTFIRLLRVTHRVAESRAAAD